MISFKKLTENFYYSLLCPLSSSSIFLFHFICLRQPLRLILTSLLLFHGDYIKPPTVSIGFHRSHPIKRKWRDSCLKLGMFLLFVSWGERQALLVLEDVGHRHNLIPEYGQTKGSGFIYVGPVIQLQALICTVRGLYCRLTSSNLRAVLTPGLPD